MDSSATAAESTRSVPTAAGLRAAGSVHRPAEGGSDEMARRETMGVLA